MVISAKLGEKITQLKNRAQFRTSSTRHIEILNTGITGLAYNECTLIYVKCMPSKYFVLLGGVFLKFLLIF